jgi:CxxC-x17-CxxC domain-containing protein
MGRFRPDRRDRADSRSGGRRFDGERKERKRFRNRDSGGSTRFERKPMEMYDAVCSKCGKECQIPFKPRTNKPLFCEECFKKNEGSERKSGSSGMSQEQFNQINEKLDRIIKALEME